MPLVLPLRAALKRGALVTFANWPVVVVEFTIESVYNLALAVPVVGGAFMVAALLGADMRALFAEGLRSAAEQVVASLVGAPVALASFIIAVVLVAFGGAVVMFLVKAGTLTVLVAGERAAGDIHQAPLRYESIRRAHAYSISALLEGAHRFGRRAVTLVVCLSAGYALVAAGYVGAMAWAVHLADQPEWASAWPLVIVLATSMGVVAVAAVNLTYDLLRIIVVSDDCRVSAAFGRLRAFLVEDARQVIGLFGVVGVLLTLATAVSVMATTGLALVAWVPVVGLVVLPLQAAAWLVRGLTFQFLDLAALSAYQTQYRRFAEPRAWPGSSRPLWVHHA
jgi:hypothetical protein